MKSKLDKLNELGELLKSGTITQEEFDNLKGELLSIPKHSQQDPKLKELNDLFSAGVLTSNEFNKLRAELLNSQKLNAKKNELDELNRLSETKSIKEEVSRHKTECTNYNKEILVKSKKNQYRVLVVILFVFIGYVIVNNTSMNNSSAEKYRGNSGEIETNSSSTINSPQTKPNIIGHIRNSNFSVNGNGNASFYVNSKRRGNRDITGSVTVTGGRATLQGEISILTDNSLMIYNLKAVSGSYDASINAGSTGVFYLQSNGNLEGTLSAKGETRNVKFVYEN